MDNNQKYWEKFYKTKKLDIHTVTSSQFSIFTLNKKKDEDVAFEFGCGNGRDASYLSKFFKSHYRNFLDPKWIIKLCSKEKLKNIYSVSANGLAVFKEEDPHISR